MFLRQPLQTLTWDSAITSRHLHGWSRPTRSSQTFCSGLKCIRSMIPCATTLALRTCSTVLDLARPSSHAFSVGRVHARNTTRPLPDCRRRRSYSLIGLLYPTWPTPEKSGYRKLTHHLTPLAFALSSPPRYN